jgi:hypothetical protein
MIYPTEVQQKLDILKRYSVNEELTTFDIIHMYPGEICYPNVYYDSRWFTAVIFNTETMEKRDIGQHDAIRFDSNCSIETSQVFVDGAFLIKFRRLVRVGYMTQALDVYGE